MKNLYIVMYHYVRDLKNSRYPNIKGLEYSLFKEQIEFFVNNFHVITMEELIEHYVSGMELPERSLLLTFDDGYIDHYLYVFPILREYHIQGSFFVPGKVFKEHCLLDVNKIHFLLANTNTSIDILCRDLYEQMDYYRNQKQSWNYAENDILFQKYAIANRFDNKETIFFKRILQAVLPEDLRGIICNNMLKKYMDISEQKLAHELYLNYDQMKEMKREGMFFGIHGFNHYWMNCLEHAQLKKDISQALDAMEGLLDTKQWVVNYPYGSYSDEVIEYIKTKGCILGLSTDVRAVDLQNDNQYTLPRLDTNDFPPVSNRYMEILQNI